MRNGCGGICFAITVKTKSARQFAQYGGETAAAVISQNFFVRRFQTTAFFKEAFGGKECTFCVGGCAFDASDRIDTRNVFCKKGPA
jgi:hypothetical protein